MSGRNVLLAVLISILSIKEISSLKAAYTTYEELKREGSIQCYDCNSENDPRCGDPFEPYTIGFVNCSEIKPPEQIIDHNRTQNEIIKPSVCRKTVQKVEGKTRVIRECGWILDDADNKKCPKRTGTKNVEVYYCSCTGTLCNTGYNVRPSYSKLGLGMLLLFVTKFINYNM